MKTGHDEHIGIDFAAVEDVKAIAKYFVLDKYLWVTILIGVTALSVIALSVRFGIVQGWWIALMIGVVYWAIMRKRARKWFMQRFAETNELTYEESASPESVTGRLFEIGNSRKISHVISYSHQQHPVRLFHYQYSIGSGKSRRTKSFTVMEVAFEKTEFPHIFLQSKTMGRYAKFEDGDRKLHLEQEFQKSFELYAREGYEIEIFQIFTPAVLRMLQEKSAHFSIEFAGNNMYIYDDKSVSGKKDLHEIMDATGTIFDSVGPLLNRLHDDFAVLHPYYGKKQK